MKYNLPTNVSLDLKLISSRIEQARLSCNYTYRDLEKKTGISAATLFRLERELQSSVPLVNILSVARATGADFLYLCGLDD